MSIVEDSFLLDKLIEEKMRTEEGPFDFDGYNCSDIDNNDCDGWDGHSRRCNCGNRRVFWQLSSCKTYIYAEAY